MTETYAEQRERILDNSDVDPAEFDLIVALGYEPESWDGMWKLPAEPILFRGLGFVILREVIYETGTHTAVITSGHKVKTRLRIRRDPLA